MPARKAPRAIEAPKKRADPVATVTAIARTVRVKSSRERSRAASSSMRGTTREPAKATRATRATSLSIATPSDAARPREAPAGPLPATPARAGITTRMATVRTSSTRSHPTAAWPWVVASSSRSSSTRMRTTVLATARAMPSTSPEATDHPKATPMARPSSVDTPLWRRAPGIAIPLTARRSLKWKCRPTPNIRRTTPISASCEASPTSPTKPGVWGPMATPASR